MPDIFSEGHHGGEVKDALKFGLIPPSWRDSRGAGGNVLSDHAAAKILLPLCRENLSVRVSDCPDPEKSLTDLAWDCLLSSGFKVFVCFVRGHVGEEEIVVVTSEGSASWPVARLGFEAMDFLEVQAL